MPPADQSAPTPAPVPETPKPEKVGFFAKLFGKKPKEEAVPAGYQSQTPPAQLSEPTLDGSTPVVPPAEPVNPIPVTSFDAPVSAEMPSMPESNPVEEETALPPLDVPPTNTVEAPKVDEGMAVPPVSDTVPSDESLESPQDPSAPKL